MAAESPYRARSRRAVRDRADGLTARDRSPVNAPRAPREELKVRAWPSRATRTTPGSGSDDDDDGGGIGDIARAMSKRPDDDTADEDRAYDAAHRVYRDMIVAGFDLPRGTRIPAHDEVSATEWATRVRALYRLRRPFAKMEAPLHMWILLHAMCGSNPTALAQLIANFRSGAYDAPKIASPLEAARVDALAEPVVGARARAMPPMRSHMRLPRNSAVL